MFPALISNKHYMNQTAHVNKSSWRFSVISLECIGVSKLKSLKITVLSDFNAPSLFCFSSNLQDTLASNTSPPSHRSPPHPVLSQRHKPLCSQVLLRRWEAKVSMPGTLRGLSAPPNLQALFLIHPLIITLSDNSPAVFI